MNLFNKATTATLKINSITQKNRFAFVTIHDLQNQFTTCLFKALTKFIQFFLNLNYYISNKRILKYY